MPGKRAPTGRSLTPESPHRCPVCREVVGYRGRRLHLRACMAAHGRPAREFDALLLAFEPVTPLQVGAAPALAERALVLRRQLAELAGLDIPEPARDRIAEAWRSELDAIQRRIASAR